MGYSRKWKPSKAKINEFKNQMNEIEEFCELHSINASSTNDSYYFTVNGQKYRISNHTVEQSDKKAFNSLGEQVREKYHNGRDDDTIYITAGKTRLIEVYNNILSGKDLDKRGNIK